MSREAEQKLLSYVTQRLGPDTVANRLSISEPQLARMVAGREWMSREQALVLADLMIKLAAGAAGASVQIK